MNRQDNNQIPPGQATPGQGPAGQRSAEVEHAPAIDIWRYINVLRKRAWVIAAVVVLGITISVLYTKRLPRIYRATASVVIDPTPPQVFGNKVQEVIQLGSGSYWSHQEYYNTQLQILTKYELARRTIERHQVLGARLLGLEQGTQSLTREQKEHAANALVAALSASQSRESRIVNLHVKHTDPALAEALANAHIASFQEYSRQVRTTDSGTITGFLEEELAAAEKRLNESEQDLLKHKEENDLLSVSLEDKQNILAADIARYTAALSEARIERIELDGVRRRAQGLDGEAIMESPIFGLLPDNRVVDAVKEQYLAEKQGLAELAQEFGPKHPEYRRQEKKVAEQLRAIEAESRRAMRELEERYQAVLATEKQFEAEVERLKQEAFELGPKTIEYNQKVRKFKSDEDNYKVLLERLSASQFTEKNEATNISPHTSARGAVLVYPRLGMNVTIAAMLSLMFGLALAFALEFMDRSIKSVEDVERVVDAPVLGTIPRVAEEDLESEEGERSTRVRDLYVFANPSSPVAEHCRSIRTNILFSSANRPMKTLTISSPQKGEGKTTSTIYLGTIMAQSKQRVLLVDTDMRRPRLHYSLMGGKAMGQGLSNLLLPDVDIHETLDQVVQETEIPNLFLLPCGPKPPNPAELLLTDRFKEVLLELEKRFDRVLLDSPPIMVMNDAVVLSRLSDGVIMVAQAQKTAIDHVARSARMIHDVNAPILGVILNNIDPTDNRYGSYYYYYGNEYYNAPRPDEKKRKRKSGDTDKAA